MNNDRQKDRATISNKKTLDMGFLISHSPCSMLFCRFKKIREKSRHCNYSNTETGGKREKYSHVASEDVQELLAEIIGSKLHLHPCPNLIKYRLSCQIPTLFIKEVMSQVQLSCQKWSVALMYQLSHNISYLFILYIYFKSWIKPCY